MAKASTSRKAGASITATTTIDFGDLQRRLADSERKILREYGAKITKGIRDDWQGWDYVGRRKGAPRNVSRKAWKWSVETAEGKAVLTLINEAKDWRTGTKSYVAYVHRAGDATPEFEHIAEDIRTQILPDMVRDLAAEVARNIGAPKQRKQLRARGGGTTVRKTLEG